MQANKLHNALQKHLGTNCRKKIKLDVRADNLYWLITLAEIGIKTRTEEYKQEAKTKGQTYLDAASIASIATWEMELEELVNQIMTQLEKPNPNRE